MIITGDCRETLKTLPAESVQTCVTSPPYFGLRDYGHAAQIGLEETPEQYVAQLVEVFREVRRVLRGDGTLWLNLGDSYAASSTSNHGRGKATPKLNSRGAPQVAGGWENPARRPPAGGLKPKDLIGIPWRVAFALQADGWWLRQDIIWAKPNPMPESIKDRCTKAHEYVFLLSKSASYFFDAKAIQEPATSEVGPRLSFKRQDSKRGIAQGSANCGTHRPDRDDVLYGEDGTRNRRSVWNICTKPYAGAHFATMPPDLAALCIQAGSRPGDTVLDPFLGSGTTGEVAESLGRRWIGCELNPEYVEQARARTAQMGLVPAGPSSVDSKAGAA